MKILPLLFFLVALPYITYGQFIERYVLSSLGSHVDGSTIDMDASLGESISVSFESVSLILTQGFQQPKFKMSTSSSSLPIEDIFAFPNPTSDVSSLSNLSGSFFIYIYNSNGSLVHSELYPSPEEIDLEKYPNGHYVVFARDVDSNKMYKSEIIKQ